MKNLSSLFSVVFILLTVGCLPYPHFYPSLPDTSGKITDSGAPLEGVQVYLGELSEKGSCDPINGPVITANDGSFSIEGAERFRFFVILQPGDSFERWAVCIKTKDKENIFFARHRINGGPVHSPASVKLFCDLSLSKICQIQEESPGKWPYGPR